MIKTTLGATLLACAISMPAMAWTNTTSGSGPQQIVDGGPGAQANSKSRSTSTAVSSSASRSRSTSGATGGAATATSEGGQGGRGGSASSNVNINSGSGGGGSGGGGRRAPDVVLPSFGGGGMDCPTVGFGAAGSGLGGGGGFGPSWISSDCNKRKVTEVLMGLYGPEVARAYAEKNIDGVAEAVSSARPAPIPTREYKYDWCYTMDAGNARQREACKVTQ